MRFVQLQEHQRHHQTGGELRDVIARRKIKNSLHSKTSWWVCTWNLFVFQIICPVRERRKRGKFNLHIFHNKFGFCVFSGSEKVWEQTFCLSAWCNMLLLFGVKKCLLKCSWRECKRQIAKCEMRNVVVVWKIPTWSATWNHVWWSKLKF